MGGKTIVDVAREAGVSFKTVSRVINREPSVKRETRERVEAVIERLNFTPDVRARALAGSRSNLIALLCRDAAQPFIAALQLGALGVSQRLGAHLVLEVVRDLPERHLRELAKMRVDGVIVAPPICDEPALLEALRTSKLPHVRISPYREREAGPAVRVDDYAGAYKMTYHLLALGHRDIAFIEGPQSHGASAERLRGFRVAMAEAGIDVREDWIVPGDFTARGGMLATLGLLKRRRLPSAIFAANDNMAAGALSAAYCRGLALPDDLSIAGFDDSPIATAVWPQLTTIRQPVATLGATAIEMLVSHAREHKKMGSFEVAVELVSRQSVRRLSAARPARADGESRR